LRLKQNQIERFYWNGKEACSVFELKAVIFSLFLIMSKESSIW